MNVSDYNAPSGDPSVLRQLNLRAVLRVLHAGGRHTITGLAKASQLSRPTAAHAVEDLVTAGWISVANDIARTGRERGRPAQTFAFRPSAGHVLGVDVGAHKVIALICDLDGTEIARARHELDPLWSADRRIQALREAISEAMSGMPDGASAISDAVIATPGNVDAAGVVTYCDRLPGWVGQNLGELVSTWFGYPATTNGDMRMAVLAEHWRGTAQHVKDVVYLHAGRRLGAAIMLDGRPHRGKSGAAGQFGAGDEVEWARAFADLTEGTIHPGLSESDAVVAVFKAAAAGDASAIHRIEIFTTDFIHGVMPVIVALDPELVVVGGGMSAAGELLSGPIRNEIERSTKFSQVLALSTLGDEGVVLGAVRDALDAAEVRLFLDLAPIVSA